MFYCHCSIHPSFDCSLPRSKVTHGPSTTKANRNREIQNDHLVDHRETLPIHFPIVLFNLELSEVYRTLLLHRWRDNSLKFAIAKMDFPHREHHRERIPAVTWFFCKKLLFLPFVNLLITHWGIERQSCPTVKRIYFNLISSIKIFSIKPFHWYHVSIQNNDIFAKIFIAILMLEFGLRKTKFWVENTQFEVYGTCLFD